MKQYVVDAFTDKVFHGNQAAICVLDTWLPESLMMNITRENNFSETAFTVKEGEKWHLRWFTPGGEIDLRGHATLGTAFVLLNFYEKEAEKVVFTTLSGDLTITRRDDLFEMEFPAVLPRSFPWRKTPSAAPVIAISYLIGRTGWAEMNWWPIRHPGAAAPSIAAGWAARFSWPARRRCIPLMSCPSDRFIRGKMGETEWNTQQ